MVLAALFDMVSLAHTVQGACMISGFEYPDGFPEQVQNQTVLNHPCPLTPACLFQISAQLGSGRSRVRHFSIPFDIPSHATPGEGYAATLLPEGLGRCPFSPNDCCDFYDSKRQSFCDAMEAWPCFFWELRPPPDSGNSIVDQAELDGAMMEVGSKWRATGLLLQGFLVSVLGLVVLSCRARRVQRAREECAQRLVRSVDHRANAWLLRLARRAARSRCLRCVFAVCCVACCMCEFAVREGLDELLLRDAAAVPLQRAVRRWLRRRHLAAFRSRVINHIEPEETRQEEVKPSTPKDTGPKDTRWVAKGLVAKSAPRNRKLLLDTGSLDNFRRFVRVRVASAPWELLRLEVALEPGAHLGISLATQQKAPPLVCGVRPRSIAEHYGVKRGFVLLKVGRFEWPNFAARQMIQELRSRPLCLILQEAPEPPEPPKLEEPSSAPQPPGMPPVPLELRPLDFGLAPAPLASRVERRFPEPPNRRPQSANASIMRLARERMETAQPRTRAGDEPRRVERRSKGSKVRPGRQSPLRPARPSSAFVRR